MSKLTKTPRANLALETLEERFNLSSYISGGDLYIDGSNAVNNRVQVNYSSGYWFNSYYRVTENGKDTLYAGYLVWGGDLGYFGCAGKDQLINNSPLNLYAWGGEGDDYISSNSGADHLWGEGGTDTLRGAGGHDKLYGGWGQDYLFGEDGNDWLDGGAGDWFVDELYGGNGADGFAYSYFSESDYIRDYNWEREGDWIWWVDV
jgi:Ca2+-binding RTX toxin-like protein